MKRIALSFIIFSTIFVGTIRATIILKGELITDSDQPVPGTRIGVSGGPSVRTDSKGSFQIRLSNDFIEGEQVIISVLKKGWVINQPLDGEWNLPNIKYQDVHMTMVIIVPFGSKALWNHARIEKYIAKLSDEQAKLKKVGNKPRPVDFSYYLSKWAEKYGFTPAQVKTTFNDWAEAVKDSDNYRTLGLRHFYKKKFSAAAFNFEKAALQGEARRKALKERIRQEDIATYENWRDAGKSLYTDYKFREALEKYKKAEKIVTLNSYPMQWTEILYLRGNAEYELGVRVEGKESHALLFSAVASYRRVLEVCKRQHFPQIWALTQNSIGNALREQGSRTKGGESVQLLNEALTAFRHALEVRTREHFPQRWAMTQNDLGIVNIQLAKCYGGQESELLIIKAVEAFRRTLEVCKRENFPDQWAGTQNNLGNAFQDLGSRAKLDEGVPLLNQAVGAYNLALEFHSRQNFPNDWAILQNNLGNVFQELGIRNSGRQRTLLLEDSVLAYRKALEVDSRQNNPQDWAMTQKNLGGVLLELGIDIGGEKGERLLEEAVVTHRKALEVCDNENFPQHWAMIQHSLGLVLKAQGIRKRGQESIQLLNESVAVYHKALKIYNNQNFPQQWARTQTMLGVALLELGIRSIDGERALFFNKAEEAFHKALKVRKFEYMPHSWALTQMNIAKLNELQKKWSAASECYLNVYKVYPFYAAAKLSSLYQNKAFLFKKALDLNLFHIKNYPKDLATHLRIVENCFTSCFFTEGNEYIATMKSVFADFSYHLIILKIFEISNFMGLNNHDTAEMHLEILITQIRKQKQDFKIEWDFTGTKYFIHNNKALEPHREWRLPFFTSLEKIGRDAILKDLRELKKAYK